MVNNFLSFISGLLQEDDNLPGGRNFPRLKHELLEYEIPHGQGRRAVATDPEIRSAIAVRVALQHSQP